MNRLFSLGLLFSFPTILAAQDAVVAIAPEGSPWWVQALWPLLLTVVVPFLVRYLNQKRIAAEAEAEKLTLDANKSLMEQKNILIDKRVIPFLWASAEHIAERDLPIVLADALDGDGKFDWKAHANRMKEELLDIVKDKFLTEGIDIVKVLGVKYLGQLIDRAIAKAIPWLPQSSQAAVSLIAQGQGATIAHLIIENGLKVANERWLKGALDIKTEETEGEKDA